MRRQCLSLAFDIPLKHQCCNCYTITQLQSYNFQTASHNCTEITNTSAHSVILRDHPRLSVSESVHRWFAIPLRYVIVLRSFGRSDLRDARAVGVANGRTACYSSIRRGIDEIPPVIIRVTRNRSSRVMTSDLSRVDPDGGTGSRVRRHHRK